MGISFTKEEEVTNAILQEYVEGSLKKWLQPEVEKWIQKSQSVFLRYVELKENHFYRSAGKPISKELEDKILKNLPKPSGNPLNHLVIRIRLLKDKIVVSSSDQEEMDYLGIMADFAWRSSEPGSVIIKRKISGVEVSIELIPGERSQEFHLAIEANPGEGLSCELWEQSEKKESLDNIHTRQIFESFVAATNHTELVFKKKESTEFRITLFLIHETDR